MSPPPKTHHSDQDLRIASVHEVLAPDEIMAVYPATVLANRTVLEGRKAIRRILDGEDDRLLVVLGPCSVHEVNAAKEYADRLLEVRPSLREDLLLVMRVYFQKPRTSLGWTGLINDPDLDETYRINKGLRLARHLLVHLAEAEMPAATEYLDVAIPQYLNDLVSWAAIGARTTESQLHRELASGLSCPVGFKNGTDGDIGVAVDAIRSSAQPHRFLSYTRAGHAAIFATEGNQDTHLVLRGGKEPNYDARSVAFALEKLRKARLPQRLMIDLSHANSGKDPLRQLPVGEDVAQQVAAGNRNIIGVMIESHLVGGRQDVVAGTALVHGQSITDACLAWKDTVPLLDGLAAAARRRRMQGSAGED